MKKINYILLVALIAAPFFFSSCKKKKDDPAPAQSPCTNVIAQESLVTTGGTSAGTETRVYYYNANKKLVKIEYAWSPNITYSNYDTITYNGSNEIVTVKSYSVGNGTPSTTKTYTYTSGKITNVNELGTNGLGPYNSDKSFTYTSGVLSAQTVIYNSGSSSGNGPENIASIVFTAGNPTSADLGSGFGGTATLTYETTAPNPYLGLNNDDDILKLFSANNCTSAYSDAAPGSPFFTNAYTYANGRVSTITDTNNGGTRVNTITYVCL